MKIILIFLVVFISACAVQPKSEQLVFGVGLNATIADELASFIQNEYKKSEQFKTITSGAIMDELEVKLRASGYAVSKTEGKTLGVYIDLLEKDFVYLRLVLDGRELTGAYRYFDTGTSFMFATDKSWTELKKI